MNDNPSCEQHAELFGAAGDGYDSLARRAAIEECRTICAGCPIQAECLSFALEWERGSSRSGRWGIYGGATPHEREKMDKANPLTKQALWLKRLRLELSINPRATVDDLAGPLGYKRGNHIYRKLDRLGEHELAALLMRNKEAAA